MDKLQYLTPILFLLPFLVSVVALTDCGQDSDCEKGYRCIQSYCTLPPPCIPCEELNNLEIPLSSSGDPLCARQESDCGDCLPGYGYQMEDLVTGMRSIKCFPLTEELSSNQSDDRSFKTFQYFISVAGVAFILSLAMAVYPSIKVLFTPSSHTNNRYVQMESQTPSHFQDDDDQDVLILLERKP